MGASATKMNCAYLAATVLAAAALAGPAAQHVAAVEPAELIDAELQRQPIQLVSLQQGRLSYFDDERRLTSADAADHVSLVFDRGEMRAPESSGRLLLADGHELPGTFGGVDDEGRLIWQHAALGEMTVPLDDVLVLLLGAAGADEEEAAEAEADSQSDEGQDEQAEIAEDVDALELVVEGGDDRVVLRNGDVLEGFVEAVNSGAIELAVGGQTLPLAWDRVAAVSLANPSQQAAGSWLTLGDGSRVRVEQLVIDADEVTGEVLGGGSLALATDAVRSVEFTQRHRRVSLAELEAEVVAGGVVFGVEMGPRLERQASQLHAPVTVAFTLPEGAKRFAAEASLAEGSLAWADLELIVRDAEGEPFRAHLNAEQSEVSVNVAISGDRLVIELDEAANGPVMDQLTLRNAAVLVGE